MFRRLLPLVIFVLLRFLFLGARPIHHDEAVNGWFVDGIFRRGYFIYDPQNYHGPLFFYLLAASEKIFGRGLIALRIPPTLIGAGVTFIPLLFRRFVGESTAWIAAAFLAISPAMVFYSRYSIHETGFMLLGMLFIWQWLIVREKGWTRGRMLILGILLGGLACMKETFILLGAALAVTEGIFSVIEWRKEQVKSRILGLSFWLHFLGVLGIALVLVGIFFTGFFHEADGFSKFFEAFTLWSGTGTQGNGHQKPFYYWVELMGREEWFAALGLLATPWIYRKVSRSFQVLIVLGWILGAIYSGVAYKTPWCLLSFFWIFILIFSRAAAEVLGGRFRIQAFVLLGIGAAVSVAQSLDVAYVNPDQDGHPYIYGQTYHDLIEPIQKIIDRDRTDANFHERAQVQVLSSFTWPIPFLLGELKHVGYYTQNNAPAALNGDVILIDEPLFNQFGSRIVGNYQREKVRSRQWAAPMMILTRLGW